MPRPGQATARILAFTLAAGAAGRAHKYSGRCPGLGCWLSRVAHAMGEFEVAAVPEAVRGGLGVLDAGRSTRACPGRLNFFSTERPWVPPSKMRETLHMEYLITMTTHVPAGT